MKRYVVVAFLPFMLSIVFASVSFAGQFSTCSGTNLIDYHLEALSYTEEANNLIKSNGIYNETVERALKQYFHLDVYDENDRSKIDRVLANVNQVASNAMKTTYRCSVKSRDIWCMKEGVVGIVPPPKNIVYLCPIFFKNSFKNERVGAIIHEWFHRWGGFKIDYLPETYCHQSNGKTASSTLIRSSDNYSMFILALANRSNFAKCGTYGY